MPNRPSYALNDFDDTYSVSDTADRSMLSGSLRGSLPFIQAGRSAALEPTRKMMREMAAMTSKIKASNGTEEDD